MFERLFKNKKYIFSYFLSLLFSLGGSVFGTNPLGIAFLGALIDNKIPVLIPSVVVLLVSIFRLGLSGLLRIALATLLYALFRSFIKGKDNTINKVLKLSLSLVITNLFLFLIKLIEITQIPRSILEIIFILLFYLIFKVGLKYFLEESKEKLSIEALTCMVILAIMAYSGFDIPILMGISVFSLVSIIALMLVSCNKPILPVALISLVVSIFFMIIHGFKVQYIILYIVAGVVTSLLSRAKKKGALIGLVITLLYAFAFGANQENVYNEYGMNPRLLKDYANFLKTHPQDMASGDLNNSGEINSFNDTEVIDSINNSMGPSTASIVLKEMVVGFVILSIMPNDFYERKTPKSSIELFIKKNFPDKKVLALGAGNPKKEPQKASNDAEKVKGGKKKSSKGKKKS